MKKFLVSILALVTVFSFSACVAQGGDGEPSASSSASTELGDTESVTDSEENSETGSSEEDENGDGSSADSSEGNGSNSEENNSSSTEEDGSNTGNQDSGWADVEFPRP